MKGFNGLLMQPYQQPLNQTPQFAYVYWFFWANKMGSTNARIDVNHCLDTRGCLAG